MKRAIAVTVMLLCAGCGSSASSGMGQQERAADQYLCANVPGFGGYVSISPDMTPALVALYEKWETINTSGPAQGYTGVNGNVPPGYTQALVNIENWCTAHGVG